MAAEQCQRLGDRAPFDRLSALVEEEAGALRLAGLVDKPDINLADRNTFLRVWAGHAGNTDTEVPTKAFADGTRHRDRSLGAVDAVLCDDRRVDAHSLLDFGGVRDDAATKVAAAARD